MPWALVKGAKAWVKWAKGSLSPSTKFESASIKKFELGSTKVTRKVFLESWRKVLATVHPAKPAPTTTTWAWDNCALWGVAAPRVLLFCAVAASGKRPKEPSSPMLAMAWLKSLLFMRF